MLRVDREPSLNIACVGAGYVGGPTCAVIAHKCAHHRVTVVDISEERIAAWNSDELPIYEAGLSDIVKECKGRNLFFSTDVDGAINEADIIFLAVNTPTKANGVGAGFASDLTYLEAAVRRVVKVARRSKILVEKSTVPCRTAESIAQVAAANARPGVHFQVLSNPEFLAEGTAIHDLLHPDRILIGCMPTEDGLKAQELLTNIYAKWIPRKKIIGMHLWSSELAKLAANALLAQRVSSINAISAICEAVGADVGEVATACGQDSRIGPHFLTASVGFGGSCFRKDILNLVYLSNALKLPQVAKYWEQVNLMNEYQQHRFSKRILAALFNTISDKHIAVLGFAFKKGTSDSRESPAINVVSDLLSEGANIRIHDCKVPSKQIFRDLACSLANGRGSVEVCETPYQAAMNAHALVILTDWADYQTLDYKAIYCSMSKPAYLFDGRSIVDEQEVRQIGFDVHIIGRARERSLPRLYQNVLADSRAVV
ncbi:UDP-glucose/GDP-mannose dehydrogenase family, NAD binding domain-containing protein [Fimicolochytrium jonesii]|uniref:UDP-glucose/GDP-mannose dehydrogenase family, NAD binding domain-containing protein n=1 Tax=Fimicolochytrium jonesii TaxID=1396493 RepID=UPI0022FE3744|nr:UDP-glucose/GDP-mannose dehydrogenase family, NAD binding domain-containing protein [Fimicolochytrium jonesii]KAI8816565.1 UDP-glucose/GDP-mannose dehydrogenase family, NAD binding domain-containing protein [Fimicolochytrium jonesii]